MKKAKDILLTLFLPMLVCIVLAVLLCFWPSYKHPPRPVIEQMALFALREVWANPNLSRDEPPEELEIPLDSRRVSYKVIIKHSPSRGQAPIVWGLPCDNGRLQLRALKVDEKGNTYISKEVLDWKETSVSELLETIDWSPLVLPEVSK